MATEGSAGARPTLAVLPFENDSGAARQQFLADGMTDEIAVALSAVPGLAVVARSSSFQVRLPPALLLPQAPESRERAKAAGAALNARYLVEGATRIIADDHARIAARLVEANDGAQLWSQDYDVEPASIFDVEEDIARKIATALKLPPGPDPLVRSRTEPYVYLDFLRAKVAARPRGAAALAEAARFLEMALVRDPDYAPAAALLAYDYTLTPLFPLSLRGGMPEEERKVVERTIPMSDELARHATALDPKSAEAFVALGYSNLVQKRMTAAEDAFKRALALTAVAG